MLYAWSPGTDHERHVLASDRSKRKPVPLDVVSDVSVTVCGPPAGLECSARWAAIHDLALHDCECELWVLIELRRWMSLLSLHSGCQLKAPSLLELETERVSRPIDHSTVGCRLGLHGLDTRVTWRDSLHSPDHYHKPIIQVPPDVSNISSWTWQIQWNNLYYQLEKVLRATTKQTLRGMRNIQVAHENRIKLYQAVSSYSSCKHGIIQSFHQRAERYWSNLHVESTLQSVSSPSSFPLLSTPPSHPSHHPNSQHLPNNPVGGYETPHNWCFNLIMFTWMNVINKNYQSQKEKVYTDYILDAWTQEISLAHWRHL